MDIETYGNQDRSITQTQVNKQLSIIKTFIFIGISLLILLILLIPSLKQIDTRSKEELSKLNNINIFVNPVLPEQKTKVDEVVNVNNKSHNILKNQIISNQEKLIKISKEKNITSKAG